MAEFYRDNTIALKSKAFALRIVKLSQISYRDTKRIYIIQTGFKKWNEYWSEYQGRIMWTINGRFLDQNVCCTQRSE